MAKGLKEAKFGVASPPWFYIAGSSFTVVQKTFEFETWTARNVDSSFSEPLHLIVGFNHVPNFAFARGFHPSQRVARAPLAFV